MVGTGRQQVALRVENDFCLSRGELKYRRSGKSDEIAESASEVQFDGSSVTVVWFFIT